MRPAVIAIALAAVACPALAQDPAAPRPAAYDDAEACLREHVASAVAVSSGAADAAEFLLTYLCADKVEAVRRYDANTAYLSQMAGTVEALAGLTAETVDPANEAGEEAALAISPDDIWAQWDPSLTEPPTVDPVTGELSGGSELYGGESLDMMRELMSLHAPTFLRVLAGQLILEHRR